MEGQTQINICIRTFQMGEDRLFLITGGKAHIGSVATAYGTGEGIRTEVQTVPGHREDMLAQELAELAASTLGCTVTVLIGIHIDNATKHDIEEAVSCANRLMREELRKLCT